jgi:hypothetical protein
MSAVERTAAKFKISRWNKAVSAVLFLNRRDKTASLSSNCIQSDKRFYCNSAALSCVFFYGGLF